MHESFTAVAMPQFSPPCLYGIPTLSFIFHLFPDCRIPTVGVPGRVEKQLSRKAHNLEVTGASPVSATTGIM